MRAFLLMDPTTNDLLSEWEEQYPGLRQQLVDLVALAEMPCAYCGSPDTAVLVVGITGRTMCLAGFSNRVKLVANRDEPGERWCRVCSRAF